MINQIPTNMGIVREIEATVLPDGSRELVIECGPDESIIYAIRVVLPSYRANWLEAMTDDDKPVDLGEVFEFNVETVDDRPENIAKSVIKRVNVEKSTLVTLTAERHSDHKRTRCQFVMRPHHKAELAELLHETHTERMKELQQLFAPPAPVRKVEIEEFFPHGTPLKKKGFKAWLRRLLE